MAKINYFRYGVGEGAIPKRGLVGVENGVATYKRLLTPKEVAKYGMIDMNRATKLAMYRSARGFTQASLAERVNISLRTYQGLELKGLNGTALATVANIAEALGIKDLRELLEDEN